METIKLKDTEYKKNFIKLVLYGQSYVGKTTFAATFPKPLILSTDGNIKGLVGVNAEAEALIIKEVMDVKTDSGSMVKMNGWEIFKNMVNKVEELPFETIVVDLLRDMYLFCRKKILKKLGIDHESEDTRQGRVWNMIQDEFLPVLRKLMTSNKNVILITHTKTIENVKNKREVKTTLIPNVTNSLFKELNTYADLAGLLVSEANIMGGIKRTLTVSPENGLFAGNRFGIIENIQEPTYKKLIEAIEKEK